jgi:hypothetical protein
LDFEGAETWSVEGEEVADGRMGKGSSADIEHLEREAQVLVERVEQREERNRGSVLGSCRKNRVESMMGQVWTRRIELRERSLQVEYQLPLIVVRVEREARAERMGRVTRFEWL